jgi:hypothetical protein
MLAYCQRLILGLALLCACSVSLSAQAPEPCPYDTCALRVRYGLFGGGLVQGLAEQRVASLGWFAPSVPLFGQRSDTAARYYSSFRRRQHSGTALSLAGVAAWLGALLIADSDNDLAGGFAIVGGVLLLGGMVQLARAPEPLSQAVWWYNRTLSGPE